MTLINTKIKIEVIKMEANINVNIRMNRELKKQFEAFCDEVGINMTTAFTMFAKKTLREHRIPFDVGCDRTENKEVLEILQEINDIKHHPEKYKTYNSTEEMFEDVLK